jgi:hypothetical protein
MSGRVTLIDPDRPEEPLEAEMEEASETVLRLAIPNTFVRFEMRRSSATAPFVGALGGRDFIFDPTTLRSKPGATKPKARQPTTRHKKLAAPD